MAEFIIRPEINTASTGDYERLHDAMYKRQIYRVIKANDNIWYDLPAGTYSAKSSNLTLKQVNEKAIAALKEINKINIPTHRDFELIVVQILEGVDDLIPNIDKSKLPLSAK